MFLVKIGGLQGILLGKCDSEVASFTMFSDSETLSKWKQTSHRLVQLKSQVQQTQNALAFSFMEVSLLDI